MSISANCVSDTAMRKMMQTPTKLVILFFFLSACLDGQNSEIKTRIGTGELKMIFPGIYFKHNSTDYATMPYTVDSCFKYIAFHIKDINDLVIWRDSLETEKLTKQRIKKFKTTLGKYKVTRIYVEPMGKEQKISRRTIEASTDSTQIKYLLSLNSVIEIAKTRGQNKTTTGSHGLWLFGTCLKHALNPKLRLNKNGREHCRWDRKREQKPAKKK